jgi:hypothetical protein
LGAEDIQSQPPHFPTFSKFSGHDELEVELELDRDEITSTL